MRQDASYFDCRLATNPPPMAPTCGVEVNPPVYQFDRRRIGSLDCGVVRPQDEDSPINTLAVFSHGFGANGDDLVGVAGELLQIMPLQTGMIFVFPEAPLSLESEGIPGGRAWWNLSIQRLISALELLRNKEVKSPDKKHGNIPL